MKKTRGTRNRDRRAPGTGGGGHHETSPMGHATFTKNKHEMRHREDRRSKQNGWDD